MGKGRLTSRTRQTVPVFLIAILLLSMVPAAQSALTLQTPFANSGEPATRMDAENPEVVKKKSILLGEKDALLVKVDLQTNNMTLRAVPFPFEPA
jgi:hypothetical protein